MSLQISYEVSDRAEVEGQPGLHAALYFKHSSSQRPVTLLGVTALAHSLDQAEVVVRENDGQIDAALAAELIKIVCGRGWNDIMIDHLSAVGLYWCDFEQWAAKSVGAIRAGELTKWLIERVRNPSEAGRG